MEELRNYSRTENSTISREEFQIVNNVFRSRTERIRSAGQLSQLLL